MTRPESKPSGVWFHPRTLLDKTYEIGIIIKGIDGALELLGALLLLLIPGRTIEHIAWLLTHNELAEEPHSFVAGHIMRLGHDLATGSSLFAILFLLTHGGVKVGLVIALLRQKLWAYPTALVALTLFLAYQIYLWVTRPSLGMAFLTVLDTVIIWLVWREWGQQKDKHESAA